MNKTDKIGFAAACLLVMMIVSSPRTAMALHNLDTIEPYTKGGFTNFESYYGYSRDRQGKLHEGSFVFGGGLKDNLSYFWETYLDTSLTGEQGSAQTSLGGMGIGMIWTPVDIKNRFSLDLVSSLATNADKPAMDGKYITPAFTSNSAGILMEVNFPLHPGMQPFINGGYYYNTRPEGNDSVFPLAIGLHFPRVYERFDILARFGWAPASRTFAWEETEKDLTLGVNILLTNSLELITGLGLTFPVRDNSGAKTSPAAIGFTVGFILSL